MVLAMLMTGKERVGNRVLVLFRSEHGELQSDGCLAEG